MRIDDEKDFVRHLEITLEEARELVDSFINVDPEEDNPLFDALSTAIDLAQAQVFDGTEKVAYVLITIKSSSDEELDSR